MRADARVSEPWSVDAVSVRDRWWGARCDGWRRCRKSLPDDDVVVVVSCAVVVVVVDMLGNGVLTMSHAPKRSVAYSMAPVVGLNVGFSDVPTPSSTWCGRPSMHVNVHCE